MKHLQNNNRALDRLITRITDELKRVIKFTKHPLTDEELIDLCLKHLKMMASEPSPSNENLHPNKENLHPNTQQAVVSLTQKQDKEEREHQRSKFIQLNKQKLQFPFPQTTSRNSITIEDVPLVRSITDQELRQEYLRYPLTTKHGMTSTQRSSNMGSSVNQSQLHSSKTYSKLRKIEQIFSRTPSRSLAKRNSLGSHYWGQSAGVLKEQNESLKAIRSNLATHLSLLQKYKHVPSLQGLIEKEARLAKKERELRELESELNRKEIELGKRLCTILKG